MGQNAASVRVEPDRTVPGVEAVPLVTASAKGVQVYRCEQKEGGPAGWVFVAPEATLFASEEAGAEVVGAHGAGPVWRWKDGSAVVGQLLDKQKAPEPGAIPWLLLRATAVPGSVDAGMLRGVGYVRRFETRGGAEPEGGCDAGHLRAEARVPYTARYTFYRVSSR